MKFHFYSRVMTNDEMPKEIRKTKPQKRCQRLIRPSVRPLDLAIRCAVRHLYFELLSELGVWVLRHLFQNQMRLPWFSMFDLLTDDSDIRILR
jgi:hypothetical protein